MSLRQGGFSLIELLVALAIGLLVTLGAGQLFLTSFSSYQTVQHISRNQEAVVFVANTIVRAIREEGESASSFTLEVAPDGKQCQLMREGKLLIDGLYKDGSDCGTFRENCYVDGNPVGNCDVFTLRLPRFEPEDDAVKYEKVSFHVMQRQP